jgi:hypothetical protein
MSLMPTNPVAASEARYSELREEVRSLGLDAQEIMRSRHELAIGSAGDCRLDPSAYVPTGVVLGTPLPDADVTYTLFSLAKSFAAGLAGILTGKTTVFAYVPPPYYHITLVNRSHFDCSEVTYMTDTEWELARSLVTDCEVGGIAIQLRGLILTRTGRLIVPGYTAHAAAFELRRSLALNHGHLGVNVPRTIHVKLGHVLESPEPSHLAAILDMVDELGAGIRIDLRFADVHTPIDRISL